MHGPVRPDFSRADGESSAGAEQRPRLVASGRDRGVSAPPAASIEIRGVSKIYGEGPKAVHAFGPVDLSIGAGEFVALLGPSGCGKSTLMLMIAGLLEPTAGAIFVDGEKVTRPRTDVGIMFQDTTLVPWRTVEGNIALQLELRGLKPRDYAPRIAELLRSVRLEDFAQNYPWQLSGGMQQRASFCQALVHEPATALLDEPLGKLDAMTRESIRNDLQALWLRTRPTVVFVTHSIEEAVQLSSRVCVMTPRPGRIERQVEIDLPWPRDLAVKRSRPFHAYVEEIQEIFHGYGLL
jgi:NitT/TauT family transport system ATP-binding protein